MMEWKKRENIAAATERAGNGGANCIIPFHHHSGTQTMRKQVKGGGERGSHKRGRKNCRQTVRWWEKDQNCEEHSSFEDRK